MGDFSDAYMNYRGDQISEELYIIGEKDGQEVFRGEYKTFFLSDHDSKFLRIIWPADRILPMDMREISRYYPVDFQYDEDNDILIAEGKYDGSPYKVTVHLPTKRPI